MLIFEYICESEIDNLLEVLGMFFGVRWYNNFMYFFCGLYWLFGCKIEVSYVNRDWIVCWVKIFVLRLILIESGGIFLWCFWILVEGFLWLVCFVGWRLVVDYVKEVVMSFFSGRWVFYVGVVEEDVEKILNGFCLCLWFIIVDMCGWCVR